MPVGVVDLFKVIKIHIDHADLPIFTLFQHFGHALMNGVAVRQTGHGIGIGQHAQSLLRPAFFSNIGAGTDQKDFIFAAAAVDEFIAEQKQALTFARFDPALHLIRAAVTEKAGDIAARRQRFLLGHKELKHVAANHFLLFQAGIFFAEAIETLNVAVLIENNDDRIGF